MVASENSCNQGIKKPHVLGDSKLLIDWESSKCQLTNLTMGPFIQGVMEVKLHFEYISFPTSIENSTPTIT